MTSQNHPDSEVSGEDIACMFSNAMAGRGYGDHDIAPNGDWHDFAFPDNRRGRKTGAAVLNLDAKGGPLGVVIDRRKGNEPIFKWRPAKGVKYKIDRKRQAALAKKREVQAAARDETLIKLKRWFYNLPSLDEDHEYLKKKQIDPGAAVYAKRDGDKIVLPIFNIRTGELQSVQTIAPDGTKLAQEGLTTSEGFIPCGYCGVGVAGQKPHKKQENSRSSSRRAGPMEWQSRRAFCSLQTAVSLRSPR